MVLGVCHHYLSRLFICLKPSESCKVEEAAQKVFQDSAAFLCLPLEIHERVFDRLDLEGLCRAQLVCRRFYELVGNRPLKFIFPPAIINAFKYGRFVRIPRIRPEFDLKKMELDILVRFMKGKELAWGVDKIGRYYLAVRYQSCTLQGKRLEGIVALYQMVPNKWGSDKIEWSVRDTLSGSYDLCNYVMTRHSACDIIGRFAFNAHVPILDSFLKGEPCGLAQTDLKSEVKIITTLSGKNSPRIQLGGASHRTFFQYLKSYFSYLFTQSGV